MTLTNVTEQMAPADVDEPPPEPIPTTFISPSPASFSTSDDHNMVDIPALTTPATQQFGIPQQESFPEYPNGNITMQIIAHPSDDYMFTGRLIIKHQVGN